MKAVLEYWVTKDRQHEREYDRIVRNAFELNGMGLPIQKVLVIGERAQAGEAGDTMYHYKFLWIIDPKVTATLGVTSTYPSALRPAMSGLSRLRRAEIVYFDEDVPSIERAMDAEFKENSHVNFIKEDTCSGSSPSKLDCQLHLRKSEDGAVVTVVGRRRQADMVAFREKHGYKIKFGSD